MTIEISQGLLKQISLHSRETYPVEACGILIGTVCSDARTVKEVWPAKNQLSSKSSYEIEPQSLLHAFAYAEQNGLDVVGFYHSHPFWSAEASEVDKARANYPGLSYLIHSIPKNETKSFYFDRGQLIGETLRIIAGEKQSP